MYTGIINCTSKSCMNIRNFGAIKNREGLEAGLCNLISVEMDSEHKCKEFITAPREI